MNETYWDSFYAKNSAPQGSSPFLSFAVKYLFENGYEGRGTVLDIGCGNLRDSIGFAEYGFNVISIDKSKLIPDSQHERVKVMKGYDATNLDLRAQIYYCRFFVHAIQEQDFDKFLASLFGVMNESSIAFVEARTLLDGNNNKQEVNFRSPIGSYHSRILYSPPYLIDKVKSKGFTIELAESGYGMAPYQDENPYITRLILRRPIAPNEYEENVRFVVEQIGRIRTRKFIKRQKLLLSAFELISKFFDDNKLEYWIGFGTLIGAVRHGSLIPWDDDLDLCVHSRNRKQLHSLEYGKIGGHGRFLNDVHYYVGFEKLNVGVDVFTNSGSLDDEEIYPLQEIIFNGIKTYAPRNYDNFIRRRYGMKSINECVVWNHYSENGYWGENFEPRKRMIMFEDLPKRFKTYYLKFK